MHRRHFAAVLASSAIGFSLKSSAAAENEGWIDLIGGMAKGLDAFKAPTGYWKQTTSVELDPASPKKLKWSETAENTGIWVNGPTGKTNNLVTKAAFGDIELKLDFNVPTGSNSGVKLQGLYEIQIFDSFGVPAAKFNASGMGGIYPRAELLPRYHHIDEGFPAKVNASRQPGQWQTMHIIFRAPRFDANGKKTVNAEFEKVLINDQLIHEKMVMSAPTGHAYVLPEVPLGPVFLQGDHGPVAFRNVKLRPLPPRQIS
ncbi:MAG: DUF1080 domain-containing protein [Isosphaeraceae bacterium]